LANETERESTNTLPLIVFCVAEPIQKINAETVNIKVKKNGRFMFLSHNFGCLSLFSKEKIVKSIPLSFTEDFLENI
jgi:hypothetical protein